MALIPTESTPAGKALAAALRLEQLKLTIATGAAAETDIDVTGITTSDRLVGILNLTDSDLPAAPTITGAGKVQSTDATTGDTLLVIWADCSA